jgi:Tfp pilus assembly protein PilZ
LTTYAHLLPSTSVHSREERKEVFVEEVERRSSNRFDKVFAVYLQGDSGLARGIARNISDGGMFIETREPFPLGSRIWVTFTDEATGSELSAQAEVRFQCFLNYAGPPGANSVRGMGVRFVEFEAKGSEPGVLGVRSVVMQ